MPKSYLFLLFWHTATVAEGIEWSPPFAPTSSFCEAVGAFAQYEIRYTNLEVIIEVFRLAVVTIVVFCIFGLGVNSDSLDALSLFCIAVNGN